MKHLPLVVLVCVSALPLTGCWVDSKPKTCTNISEARGEIVARASLKRFLQYVGQAHAPLTGPSGNLDSAKLEHVSDNDLIYDGRSANDDNIYNFHLGWAPRAKFTATVSSDCDTTNNWTIG